MRVGESVVVENRGKVKMWSGGRECSGLRRRVVADSGREWWLVVGEMLDVQAQWENDSAKVKC